MLIINLKFNFCLLYRHCTSYGRHVSPSAKLAWWSRFGLSAQQHCPQFATTMQFLLGWGNLTCGELASIGPQLLTNSSTTDFRSWDVTVVSHKLFAS